MYLDPQIVIKYHTIRKFNMKYKSEWVANLLLRSAKQKALNKNSQKPINLKIEKTSLSIPRWQLEVLEVRLVKICGKKNFNKA